MRPLPFSNQPWCCRHSFHLFYALVLVTFILGSGGCLSTLPIGLESEYNPELGPRIKYDPYAKPFALIPFPNDTALRVSSETLSGVSWNTPLIKPTEHENELRSDYNQLDGFGPFAPILVTFDGPLDLSHLTPERVVLVNIERGHTRYGEQIPLDLGRGFFPAHTEAHSYFEYDPYKDLPSLVLPESNIRDGRLINEYDTESNTLILRPILPLAQDAQYAVLLSKQLTGQGELGKQGAIQSPFPFKAHASQIDGVQDALELVGWKEADLAFGWTYTTLNVTRPLTLLRDGMYGQGLFADYETLVPAKIHEIRDTSVLHDSTLDGQEQDPQDHRFILQAEFLGEIFKVIAQISGDQNLALTFEHVDYFVFGQFNSPQIRNPDQGKIDVNWMKPSFKDDEGQVKTEPVPFMISIPKTTAQFSPPFPVMFYFHGTGTSRFEATAIADRMAHQGLAVFSFDQVGHGPLIPNIDQLLQESSLPPALISTVATLLARLLAPDRQDEFVGLEPVEAFELLESIGLFAEFAVHGRAYDEDQNGRQELAEGFFHANPFKMCGSFLQDLVDFMQAVRLIRNLDVSHLSSNMPAVAAEMTADELQPFILSGDFNIDGVLDVGGPDVALSAAGTSLGGIHSVMAAAIEPEISVVSPIVAGGGLAHTISRTTLHFILEDVLKETFGAMVIGCPHEGQLYLLLGSQATRCNEEGLAQSFAQVSIPHPEAKISLSSPDHEERVTVSLNEQGGFYAQLSVDRGSMIQVEITAPEGPSILIEVESDVDGSSYQRNSSDLLRAFILEQHALGLCDPINFARHLFWEPLEGHAPKSVLFLNAEGDTTVPISNGILLGLASGIFGQEQDEWWPTMIELIERGVFRGEHLNLHGIFEGTSWETEENLSREAFGLFEPVDSGEGQSSMHLAAVEGKHEWIAGFSTPTGFEYGRYSQNQMSIFHACGGRVIMSQPIDCLSQSDCELLDTLHQMEACQHVSIDQPTK